MRELGKPYEVVENPEATRSRILLVAAEMFAYRGYGAVSVRDIASAAGIQAGTMYAYFTQKQEILEEIVGRFERELYEFYDMLDQLSEKAKSLREILQNIFVELREGTNPFSYYACWCACVEQFSFEACRRVYHDVYFAEGAKVMRRQLETAVSRGLVKPFDVKRCQHMITQCVLMLNSFYVGRFGGFYPEFDPDTWCRSTIANVLQIAGEPVPEEW